MIWTTIQLITTIYIAFFVPEIDVELKKILDDAKAKKSAGQDSPAIKKADSQKKRISKKSRKVKRNRSMVKSSSNDKALVENQQPNLET